MVGALAQVAAAIITIPVVLYAARQIKNSNRAERTSQYQAALNMMFDWRSDIINDADIAKSIGDPLRGSAYFHDVIERYGAKSYFHTVKLFHILEYLHILHKESVITDQMWAGWQKNLELIVTAQDTREIWARLKNVGIFEDQFEALVDEIVKAATTAAMVRTLPSAEGGSAPPANPPAP